MRACFLRTNAGRLPIVAAGDGKTAARLLRGPRRRAHRPHEEAHGLLFRSTSSARGEQQRLSVDEVTCAGVLGALVEGEC